MVQGKENERVVEDIRNKPSHRERNLSGHLVESLASGFAIHLRISFSEVKGDAFMGALGVNRMEDHPVVKMEGDKVVDTEFECRD